MFVSLEIVLRPSLSPRPHPYSPQLPLPQSARGTPRALEQIHWKSKYLGI